MGKDETLFNAVLRPPKGEEQSYTDSDGNERDLFRNVSLFAESKEAATEILTEREAKQEIPYHVESVEAA